jgi:hypothetical protein
MRTSSTAVAAATALSLALAACSGGSDYVYEAPATVVEVDGDLSQIELTQAAADRTGIQTAPVQSETIGGADRLVIPYSAVMYHLDGSTWTYTNPSGLMFLRAPIDIDRIEGERAILTAGPTAGTAVVTVGAAELYGTEFGVGK